MRPCAKRPVSECAPNECVRVRRSGKLHHCRKYPSKKSNKKTTKTSKKSNKKKRTLSSAQTKVWSALRKRKMSCSDFALTQRNGTCYMAAATLMFSRVALKSCNVEDVRKYIRFSNANEWDSAHGQTSDQSCPRIPKKIRQYYAFLQNTGVKRYTVHRMKRSDAAAAYHNLVVEKTDMQQGGHPGNFLVAIFWAAEIDCLYTFLRMPLLARSRTMTGGWGKTPMELIRERVLKMSNRHPFHVLDCEMEDDGGFRLADECGKMLEVLNDAVDAAGSRNFMLQGVLITVAGQSSAHVIAVYPCYSSGGALKWICCNSWGESCSRADFESFFKNLHDTRGYSVFRTVTLMVRTPKK